MVYFFHELNAFGIFVKREMRKIRCVSVFEMRVDDNVDVEDLHGEVIVEFRFVEVEREVFAN